MGKVVIEAVQPGDAEALCASIRDTPDLELVGSPLTKLQEEIRSSVIGRVARYEGEVAVIWGVKSSSMVSGYGYLWMCTAAVCDEHPFLLARYSRLMIEELSHTFNQLHGVCYKKYHRSKLWLKWLGFEIIPYDDKFVGFQRSF